MHHVEWRKVKVAQRVQDRFFFGGGVTYVIIPDFRWGTEPKSQRIRLHLDPVARQGVAPVVH